MRRHVKGLDLSKREDQAQVCWVADGRYFSGTRPGDPRLYRLAKNKLSCALGGFWHRWEDRGRDFANHGEKGITEVDVKVCLDCGRDKRLTVKDISEIARDVTGYILAQMKPGFYYKGRLRHDPLLWDINNGWCEDWGEELIARWEKLATEEPMTGQIPPDGHWYDRDYSRCERCRVLIYDYDGDSPSSGGCMESSPHRWVDLAQQVEVCTDEDGKEGVHVPGFISTCGHYVVEYNGKYYDCQAPDGVDSAWDLPIWKQEERGK